jgi:LuxR family quorum-sensing transcriptional regulator LasR
MKSIERFASLLEQKNEEILLNSIFKLGNDYGFQQTLIAVVPDRQTTLDNAFLRSNYSSRWRSIYDSTQLVNIDPTVTHCVMRSTPLLWEPAIFSSKKQKEMYEEASSHGLRSGITLPFHGAEGELGIICFVNDVKPSKDFQKDALHNMFALSMIRDFAFEASLRFVKPKKNEPPPTLTHRELECLKWCAAGKSSWEIAKILHCSEATINFHFGNVRRKFNTASRRQAVVKAIQCGLLHAH